MRSSHLIFNFPLCKLYSNSLMSSLNSRRGWRLKLPSRGSSNMNSITATSVNQGILLTSNRPTSSLGPSTSPLSSLPVALRSGPYGDNFNNDNGLVSSYGRKVHPGHISGVIIPVCELRFQKYFLPF